VCRRSSKSLFYRYGIMFALAQPRDVAERLALPASGKLPSKELLALANGG
jgi:hypothetical protein